MTAAFDEQKHLSFKCFAAYSACIVYSIYIKPMYFDAPRQTHMCPSPAAPAELVNARAPLHPSQRHVIRGISKRAPTFLQCKSIVSSLDVPLILPIQDLQVSIHIELHARDRLLASI